MMALSDVSTFDDLKKICEPPSLKIHKLKGGMKEFWSITIEKPWCIICRYIKGKFLDVELEIILIEFAVKYSAGDFLKTMILEERGLSQKWLAKKIGCAERKILKFVMISVAYQLCLQ